MIEGQGELNRRSLFFICAPGGARFLRVRDPSFPEQARKYHPNDGKAQSLYAGMVKLLCDNGHEE